VVALSRQPGTGPDPGINSWRVAVLVGEIEHALLWMGFDG